MVLAKICLVFAAACPCTVPPGIPRDELPRFLSERAWEESAAVFVARVVGSDTLRQSSPDTSWVETPQGSQMLVQRPQVYALRYHVEVLDAWKGTVGTDAHIVAEGLMSSCGRRYTIGETYLIYADEHAGRSTYETISCSRVLPLSAAELDLERLARRRAGWQGARSHGS